MSLFERIKKLVLILGHPHTEIVLELEYDGIMINTIEVDGDNIYVNIWDDQWELRYDLADLSYEMKKYIVQELEDLL
jgi:hypothetical protein